VAGNHSITHLGSPPQVVLQGADLALQALNLATAVGLL
jgi:hypothetical protein